MPNPFRLFETPAAAVIATGLCFALSSDLGTIWPLALIAPVPILLFAFRSRISTVAVAAFLARIIGAVGIVIAYGDVLPPLPLALALVVEGIQFALAVLATRWANRNLSRWAIPFTFASCAIGLEFVWSLISPHGSFGALGYSLIDALPLIQIASLGGVAAVGFVVALFAAAMSVAIDRPQYRRSAVAIGAIPLALSLAFGIWRLAQPYESHTRVGLAAVDSLTAASFRGSDAAHAVAREYARVLQTFRGQNVSEIVLPERVFLVSESDSSTTQMLQDAANSLGVRIVGGFDDTNTAGEHRNTARVFAPNAAEQVYAKRKLVPGLEVLTPGHQALLMGDRGVAICKDMDFPSLFPEYGTSGTQLLLVPAWDFVKDGRLHSRMAVMRGVENGFAIARAAATGRLTASDAYGRIIAEAVTSRSEPVTLVADVGLTSERTLYSRIGDAFAWCAVAAACALLIWTALLAVKARRSLSTGTVMRAGADQASV